MIALKEINMCNDAMFNAVFRSIEARKIVVSILSKLTGIEEERLNKADFQGGELVKRKITEKKKKRYYSKSNG